MQSDITLTLTLLHGSRISLHGVRLILFKVIHPPRSSNKTITVIVPPTAWAVTVARLRSSGVKSKALYNLCSLQAASPQEKDIFGFWVPFSKAASPLRPRTRFRDHLRALRARAIKALPPLGNIRSLLSVLRLILSVLRPLQFTDMLNHGKLDTTTLCYERVSCLKSIKDHITDASLPMPNCAPIPLVFFLDTCQIQHVIQHFPLSTAAVLPEPLAAQLAGPDGL